MQTKQSEQENSQNSTETGNKGNSPLNKETMVPIGNIERIEDTVFSICNDPNHGWFLAIGANRITEPVETREECISKLETKEKWDIIMKMIILVTEATHEVDLDNLRKEAVDKYIKEHPDTKVVKV